MPERVRVVVIGFLACGFAVLAAVWIAALTSKDDTASASTPTYGSVKPAGVPVPDLSALHNQDGQRVTPSDGEAVYVFIYSHCRDSCPAELQSIRYALDHVDHHVPVYGISVDPDHDTPASVKAFMIKQFMTGKMQYLLGTRAQLQPVWTAFATTEQTKANEHTAGFVVAQGGVQRLSYLPSMLSGSGIARDLRRLGA